MFLFVSARVHICLSSNCTSSLDCLLEKGLERVSNRVALSYVMILLSINYVVFISCHRMYKTVD